MKNTTKHLKHNKAQTRIYKFVHVRTTKPQNIKGNTTKHKKNATKYIKTQQSKKTPQSTHSHLQIRTNSHQKET